MSKGVEERDRSSTPIIHGSLLMNVLTIIPSLHLLLLQRLT